MTEKRIDSRPIKEIFPNATGIIVYAFTLNEVDYFEFEDYNNTPSDRAFNALSFFKELDMGCDGHYLDAHVQAGLDILNHPKEVRLTDLAKLFHQMQERRQYLQPIEIAYKLCGVVFFDATEHPNHFEYNHCIQKAEKFKEAPLDAFFLNPPIKKLLPYIASLSKDLPEFYRIAEAINQKHIENISTMLSEASKNKEFYRQLLLQKQKDLVSMKQND